MPVRLYDDKQAEAHDAGRENALRQVEDWLRDKAAKAERFVGGEPERNQERATTYHNAAEWVRRLRQ